MTHVAPAPTGRTEARRASRPRRRILKDVVLGVAAALGVLGVLWAILAPMLGLSIIVFRSGSMSPTIPTGSAAIVHSIPAAEIRVGNVVTVSRGSGTIPITHRVVSVATVTGDRSSRSIVLRGDANRFADAAPYVVKAVGRVQWSVPVLGTLLAIARTPLFLATMTVMVAALVLWAFWPARRSGRDLTGEEAATGRTPVVLPQGP